MSDQDWQAGFAKSLGVFLNGSAIRTMDERGRHVVDDSFYVMFNAHSEPVEFVLPESKWGEQWTIALDTNDVPEHLVVDTVGRQLSAGEHLHVQGWSLVLLRRVAPTGPTRQSDGRGTTSSHRSCRKAADNAKIRIRASVIRGRIKLAGVRYTLLALFLAAAACGRPGRAAHEADHRVGRRQPHGRPDGRRRGLRAHRRAPCGSTSRASNVLARQIVNGAPVDLFISADEAQMDVVAAAGLLKDGSRVALLRNQLAVAVPERSAAHLQEHPRDRRPRVQADRDRGSRGGAGRRLREAVPARRKGCGARSQARLVPTGSVRAALAAVESGAADAAIVYRTDVRVALKATVAWIVPADRGPRIVYPGRDRQDHGVRRRSEALPRLPAGDAAVRIFERFGFATVQ